MTVALPRLTSRRKFTMRAFCSLALLATCAAFAGCGSGSDDAGAIAQAPSAPAAAPAEPARTAPAADEAWDDSRSPLAGTTLEITPNPASFCDGARQVVEVTWDMAAAEPMHLQLWAEDARGKRNLWVASKTMASTKRTGNWATEGLKFTAVDARGGIVLNTATIVAAPCAGN